MHHTQVGGVIIFLKLACLQSSSSRPAWRNGKYRRIVIHSVRLLRVTNTPGTSSMEGFRCRPICLVFSNRQDRCLRDDWRTTHVASTKRFLCLFVYRRLALFAVVICQWLTTMHESTRSSSAPEFRAFLCSSSAIWKLLFFLMSCGQRALGPTMIF